VTDPDVACEHPDFSAEVEVNRIVRNLSVAGYSASIKVWCAECHEQFRWIGVQAGARGDRPMCSIDESELRAPLRPASTDPDFGMGIPGFAISGEWRL
jgi:hypothetical protein